MPYINTNPPQVYMCSPSWTLLSPPSLYHPSGLSQFDHLNFLTSNQIATDFVHSSHYSQAELYFHFFPMSLGHRFWQSVVFGFMITTVVNGINKNRCTLRDTEAQNITIKTERLSWNNQSFVPIVLLQTWTFCKQCGKHQALKVAQYKKGRNYAYVQGKWHYERKQSGYGEQTKPIFQEKLKSQRLCWSCRSKDSCY